MEADALTQSVNAQIAATDASWRRAIDRSIAEIQSGLAGQDVILSEVQAEMQDHRDRLAAGNNIIMGLDAKLTLLSEATRPMVDAMQTMQQGIRTIGLLGKWGHRLVRVVVWVSAIYMLSKFVVNGSPWAESWEVFWRTLK